jgi:two-component system sporulation sensor kinase B
VGLFIHFPRIVGERMEMLDSLLYNMVVILLSVCLFEMFDSFGTGNWHALREGKGQLLLTFANSITTVFCLLHPIPLGDGAIDLRLVPYLVSFIYGSAISGFVVALITLCYQYFFLHSGFLFALSVTLLAIPICLVLTRRSARRSTLRLAYPMRLTVVCLATIFVLHHGFVAMHRQPFPVHSFKYLAVYYSVHIGAMWLIWLFIQKLQTIVAMRKKLIHAEKLGVLSELAAAVAHEIRNPMTVARGFMQLLHQSEVSEEKKRVYTSMVIEEIDRAESIINDYLSFAKPEARQIETLDLKDAVQTTMQVIAPYAAARAVEVNGTLAGSPMPIVADPEKLVKSLVNICKISIDTMPNGGVLRLLLQDYPDRYSLVISDNGDGMSEEEISRLGSPYYAMNTEGTGLGMMVAYRVIESLKGHIDVASKPGAGSTFTVSLVRQRP